MAGDRPVRLADYCDAGRILGPADPYDMFWALPCPRLAAKQVGIPEVSAEEFDLCTEHAEAPWPQWPHWQRLR